MNEEKIKLFAAGVVRFIVANTDAYRLVPTDWVVDLSNLYTMPGWNIDDIRCHPTLCFIQYLSDNDEINKEVVRRIKIAPINKEYLHVEGEANVELRTRLLNEKQEKIRQIEALIEPMTGKFLCCYYYHGGFMDGDMSSYDYLPMSL